MPLVCGIEVKLDGSGRVVVEMLKLGMSVVFPVGNMSRLDELEAADGTRVEFTIVGEVLMLADTARAVVVLLKIPADGRLNVTFKADVIVAGGREGTSVKVPGDEELGIGVAVALGVLD